MENNGFFLDIFNNLLKINENSIIIVFDVDGNIWFSFRDVIKSLDYNNINNVVYKTIINEKNKIYFKNIRLTTRVVSLKNIQPNQLFINESGLYEFLILSTKPLAKQFMHKYFTDIMPQIRKTGKYILNEVDKDKLDKVNNKLENYKQELRYYYDKYEFVPSENGYLYINENNSIENGKNIKCYKIGYASDMNERLRGYKVGNFNHKILCYIPLDIDRLDVVLTR